VPRRRHAPTPGSAHAPDTWGWDAFAIFAVALFVRLVHVSQIRKAPFFSVLMGDARAYDQWAGRIARGDWLGREVFYQAPLYPYFLGLVYRVAGRDLLIVRLCQAILGSVACLWLGLAGRRLFSRQAGLIAGLLLALYAPAIFFDALLQKTVLDVFFICLTIWIVSELVERDMRQRWPWLWLGLSMGALSLTRENALVLAAAILPWIFLRDRAPNQARVATAGAFVLGLALVLVPVIVRNTIVGGGLYGVTSQFGPNLYIGNNASADGTYMPLRAGRGAPEYERQDATELAERAVGRHLTPAEISGYWENRAIDFIRSHPAAWLRLMGRKVALLLNATEAVDTESQESYAEWSTPVRIAAHVGHFGVLVPLAAFGVWATWPQRRRLSVLYAMTMAYAASVVMFCVFARYRVPLVPFLVLFASAGVSSLPRVVRASPIRRLAPALACIAVIAVFANWPILSSELMRAVTENNLGVALEEEGRLGEAADHYRRAVALQADYAPAYNNLGTALHTKGELDESVAAYERALALQPDFADAHYNLANVLAQQRKPDAAIDHFRRALRSLPGSVDVHTNLGSALAAANRFEDAIAQFREALGLDPDAAKTHRNLGNALASHGLRDEAIDHLRRAVQLDSHDGQAHYDLASVLLDARQLADAVDEFRAALALTPGSVDAHNNLGIALASQGSLEDAINEFQQALALRPDFEDAQRNLTTALRARRPAAGRGR
jgi:tetratricopeptide (TPR) repeat protein/4-amino-4-deoxy-L-arabinose transferase-like glycosyltransferase